MATTRTLIDRNDYKSVWLYLTFALFFCWQGKASAYTLWDEQAWHPSWVATKTIDWYYNPQQQPSYLDQSTVINALQAAADQWSTACGVTFNYKGLTTSVLGTGADTVLVQFAGIVNPNYGGVQELEPYVAGYAQFISRTGSSYLSFQPSNGSRSWSSVALLDVALHEWGHILGIGHSETANSTMYFMEQGLQRLTNDDINACRAIYQASRSTPNAFSFAPATAGKPGELVTSARAKITGITRATVSIDGGQYQIEGVTAASSGWYGDLGPWTALNEEITNGQDVVIRVTAPDYGQTATATLTIGGAAQTFSVTTAAGQALSLGVTGRGSGSVEIASPDAWYSCDTTCTKMFSLSSMVTLTAIPASGDEFDGWSGACSGTARTCSITMDKAQSVSARFVRRFYLSAGRGGSGAITSTPAGIDCGGDCSERFEAGTQVTLTAIPMAGETFLGWLDDCTGTATTCTLEMTGNKHIYASFGTLPKRWLNAIIYDGRGAIVSSPEGISCGTDCVEGFVENTTITLTATPESGWAFVSWGDACAGTTPTCTVDMSENRIVYATFALTNTSNSNDCLLNWAEDRYPTLFVPSRPASQTFGSYILRTYSQTGTYLALSADPNGRVYYYAPLAGSNALLDLGLISTWKTQAGCAQ